MKHYGYFQTFVLNTLSKLNCMLNTLGFHCLLLYVALQGRDAIASHKAAVQGNDYNSKLDSNF